MSNLKIIVSVILFLTSCSSEKFPGILNAYFPSKSHLETGIAHKYYMHGTPKEGFPFTDIRYEYYSLLHDSIKVETFNAGFEKIQEKSFIHETGQLSLLKEKHFSIWDTTEVEIHENGFLPLETKTKSILKETILNRGRSQTIRNEKSYSRDTVIAGKTGFVIREELSISELNANDTVYRNSIGSLVFVNDIGLISSIRNFDNATYRYELIEQIPGATFKKLMNHNLKRIAYIDSAKAFVTGKHFKLCYPEVQIHDYYNSTPPGGFLKGKKEMVKIITTKLDPKKLFNESGYLTFRFVVNCNGEAGRFVTEQSSLDFQTKQFRTETIEHLLEIMTGLEQWRPVVTDKPVDAYFYITFKLQDGQLKEVLP